MRPSSRYQSASGPEGEFEPGSRGRVLKNLLGIHRKSDMDRAEFRALLAAQERYLSNITPETRFTAKLLRQMHRDWLGAIYAWAGNYRIVEMSKDGFRWPPAFRVEANMARFEAETLRTHTPCKSAPLDEVVRAIVETHAELLLIHPFREGNGRVARWLADLMSLQAGLPAPDYDFRGARASANRERYLTAVKAGYLEDFEPLCSFFTDSIRRSIEGA